MSNFSEATMCEATTTPKYANLMQIHSQLIDIHQHICELNDKLGVIMRIDESEKSNCPVDSIQVPSPESLVRVLDELPGMVTKKADQIHNLLNNLEKNLI